MQIRLLTSAEDLDLYQTWVEQRSHSYLWQSLEWKQFQESLGREVRIYAGFNDSNIVCSALVVIDKTVGGFSTWEIARGPLWSGEWEDKNKDWEHKIDVFLNHIINNAKTEKCISFYFSTLRNRIPNLEFRISNSERFVQPQATRIIDLTQSHEEILAQMKPKGRYNIKVAQKNDVHVEQSADVASFAKLHNQTAGRNIFKNPGGKTYRAFLENIEGSFLFLAYQTQKPFEDRSGEEHHTTSFTDYSTPIAGLLGVIHNQKATYYYGASDYAHRALMAPYILQWEAMQYCKAQGATSYDLFGIAPPCASQDTASDGKPPESKNHPWAGITSFKEKFGGELIEYPPEQEIVLRPFVKKALQVKRKFLG